MIFASENLRPLLWIGARLGCCLHKSPLRRQISPIFNRFLHCTSFQVRRTRFLKLKNVQAFLKTAKGWWRKKQTKFNIGRIQSSLPLGFLSLLITNLDTKKFSSIRLNVYTSIFPKISALSFDFEINSIRVSKFREVDFVFKNCYGKELWVYRSTLPKNSTWLHECKLHIRGFEVSGSQFWQ